MLPNLNFKQNQTRGFTLLETLVALGVASVLIATLIPISRNTLFRITFLRDEVIRLSKLESIINSPDPISVGRTEQGNLAIDTRKRALSPFEYGKEVAPQWQPVLVTVDVKSPSGALTRTEVIRLERSAP